MNWDDWEFVWKRQAPPLSAAADIDMLRQTFETKRRKMARALVARDTAEAATGVLLSAFLAYVWWRLGSDGWPLGLAIALTLGVSAFFMSERIRVHRGRLGPDASMLLKLDSEIAELRRQRRLLFGIATWYLAPIGASWAIVVVTVGRVAGKNAPPGYGADLMRNPATAAFILIYFVVIAPLCFWGTWVVNRRAASRRIDPRIAELEKLRRELAPSQ